MGQHPTIKHIPQLSTTPMSTTIPPEMVDYTIDFLYDDNASLKSCSLLSRSSLSTSHFHLFRRLVLEQKGSRDFEAFLTLLRSPTYLKFHVQELCLQDESEDDARRPIDSASLYAVLQNLPKLRGLLLCGVALFQSPFNYQWAPLQSLKRLTVYNVINCDDIILRVAAFFSSVSELYLLEASPYPLTLPVLGEPNVTGMSISSITTEGRNLAIISRILHNLTNFLTSLDISFPLWELAAHLSELAASLRIAGAYVQHLRLDITSICCLDIYSSMSRWGFLPFHVTYIPSYSDTPFGYLAWFYTSVPSYSPPGLLRPNGTRGPMEMSNAYLVDRISYAAEDYPRFGVCH